MNLEERKEKHIEMCLNEDVETGSNLFEFMELIPKALPEIGIKDIDTSVDFLGKKLRFPLIISGMCGGTETGKKINKKLAQVAQKFEIGFEVGSQRVMIEDEKMVETFQVRDVAPDILLFGNIGVMQVREYSVKELKELVDTIQADALCIHINPAQELFQKEKEDDFEDCLMAIKRVARVIPVIAKGVGQGFERDTAIKLQSAGVKAIETGGSGGTNWIKVDAMISGQDFSAFEKWGIPTAGSIIECKKTVPLIASGGIRTGHEMAKAIALGSEMCGIALPFLKAWKENKVEALTSRLETEFKTAMYLCGCKQVRELRKRPHVLYGKLKEYADQRQIYQKNIRM